MNRYSLALCMTLSVCLSACQPNTSANLEDPLIPTLTVKHAANGTPVVVAHARVPAEAYCFKVERNTPRADDPCFSPMNVQPWVTGTSERHIYVWAKDRADNVSSAPAQHGLDLAPAQVQP